MRRPVLCLGPILALAIWSCVGQDPAFVGALPEAGAPAPDAATDPSTTEDATPADATAERDAGPPAAEGKIEWAKHFGTSSQHASLVAVAPDGSIFLATPFGGVDVDFEKEKLTSPGATYDIALLKLDPNGVVQWVKRLGGDDNELPRALAVDAQGDVYLSGRFYSASFDVLGEAIAGGTGGYDGFIVKLGGATGDRIWAKGFIINTAVGNPAETAECTALAIHDASNLAFGCAFRGRIEFDSPSSGLTHEGSVASLYGVIDAQNGKAKWSTYLHDGSGSVDAPDVSPAGVEIDGTGNVYAAGASKAPTLSTYDEPVAGSARKGLASAYVIKLAPGGAAAWARTFGAAADGGLATSASAIALEPASLDVYLAGHFRRADFGLGERTATGGAADDGYVVRLSATGTTVWDKVVGGDLKDDAIALAIDPLKRPIVVGLTGDAPVTIDLLPLPGKGFFAVKLDPASGAALFATGRTAGGGAMATDVAVAPNGHAVVTGSFSGAMDLVKTESAIAGYDTFVVGLTP